MKSVFDPKIFNKNISSKIAVALDKISEALRVNLWKEYKKHKLSPIQVRFLTFILLKPAELSTVSKLAKEFDLTKPTVSDAVKALEQKGLLKRKSEREDKRIIVLSLTAKGEKVAKKVSGFANDIALSMNGLSDSKKKALYSVLLEMVTKLHEKGTIQTARICPTCGHYLKSFKSKKGHYCQRRKSFIKEDFLEVDCEHHSSGKT